MRYLHSHVFVSRLTVQVLKQQAQVQQLGFSTTQDVLSKSAI